MFYLEDFVENMEDLPQEMRNRFTKLREMDLQVENSMDGIQKKVNTLFSKADNMNSTELETNFNAIMKEGEKSIEQSEDKVKMAGDMHELMTKYMKRLDLELHKFKMELEADNSGITEVIEQRSLDSEPSNITNQIENEYSLNKCLFGKEQKSSKNGGTSKQKSISIATNFASSDVASPSQRDTRPTNSRIVPSSLTYTLGHVGAGSPATAATASRAIIVTQQLSQGRRTTSLKASHEAINSGTPLTSKISSATGILPSELLISKELAGVAHLVNPNMYGKRKHKGHGGNQDSQSSNEDVDKPINPNEARYCICNQLAYSTMDACDNKECCTTKKSRRSHKTT